MTPEQVRARVQQIAANARDAELAHSMEDTLYLDVLTAIAGGRCTDPVSCAAEAVKSQGIGFGRWKA